MILELQQIQAAPSHGTAMIYYRTGLYYGTYTKTDNEIILANNKQMMPDVLELHLFDQATEYRAVLSQAANLTQYIESVISDESQLHDYKIAEECYLEDEYQDEKIGIMNYMQFDENDLLHLVNYRLYQVEGGKNNV